MSQSSVSGATGELVHRGCQPLFLLGVDGKKLVATNTLVYLAKPTAERRPDLHAMLNRLIGTADEATVERLLRGLVESANH